MTFYLCNKVLNLAGNAVRIHILYTGSVPASLKSVLNAVLISLAGRSAILEDVADHYQAYFTVRTVEELV